MYFKPSWRILFIATGLQLVLSLLPCAIWPWLGFESGEWRRALPVIVCLAAVVTLSLWLEVLAVGGRDDIRSTGSRAAMGGWISGLLLLATTWVGLVQFAGRAEALAIAPLIAGTAIAILGMLLRALAIRELGANFRTEFGLPAGSRLHTTGLYAWMRHPSETGLLLLAGGTALLLQSWLAGVVVVAILFPLIVVRLVAEEQVLRQQCGAIHMQYCRRTPLLFPRLARW